ncbi:MAG: hypothetical protein ABSF38_06100 [Verrucomicrobiota bacterium]
MRAQFTKGYAGTAALFEALGGGWWNRADYTQKKESGMTEK